MRVVVAEDVMLTRAGIVRLLTDAAVEVAVEAEDLDGVLLEVDRHRPDAAVVDIRMPPTHTDEGLVAAQRIRDRHPGTAVLALSQYLEPAYAMRLLEEHPVRIGHLLKDRVRRRGPRRRAAAHHRHGVRGGPDHRCAAPRLETA